MERFNEIEKNIVDKRDSNLNRNLENLQNFNLEDIENKIYRKIKSNMHLNIN